MHRPFFLLLMICSTTSASDDVVSFEDLVAADQPAVRWQFRDGIDYHVGDSDRSNTIVPGTVVGKVKPQPGPTTPLFPGFTGDNPARSFDGKSYLRFKDPGESSVFDFDKRDEISIEAWIAPSRMQGQFSYVVGKGRTWLPGQVKENHNWSLRLSKRRGGAALSFMFRSAGEGGEYHRWESDETLGIGDGWHHIVITYVFGQQRTVRGYIDGELVTGKWQLGGDTERAPVVNNDEIWIGSAMAGNRASTFAGGLDEVALYRCVLPADRIAQRYRFNAPPLPDVNVPEGRVLVQLLDGIPDRNGWNHRAPRFVESFTQEVFAFPQLPKRYNSRGVHVDRPTPYLMRAYADVVIPDGPHRLLFRSREASRLFMDDKLLAETDFFGISEVGNGPIWDLDRSHGPNIRPLQRGDRQQVVEVVGDGSPHRLRLEVLVALRGRRAYMGDASVSIGEPEGDFQIISFGPKFELTEPDWRRFREWDRQRLIAVNKQRRDQSGVDEIAYWKRRHQAATEFATSQGHDSNESIDGFVGSAKPESQTDPLSDLAYLRRVSLDIIGTIPDRGLIRKYQALPSETRRGDIVDLLLQDEGWADHWVGYWQDVLAENPNIVNPTLNNTGPFRWWIHESFLENKPFDRMVTELIMMEGGRLEGGPAGFEIATANDVPMAAKSHLIGQAFLGVQMKCARCHDAPHHEVVQEDLFSVAAMLKRSPEDVPMTSSIDLPPEELEKMAVTVSLKPGSKVQPRWPFSALMADNIPEGVLRQPLDSREKLAALITAPQNQRFAQVVVNRLWKRYIGSGLVDSVDDWEFAEISNQPLLDWLAMEFVASGYDLQHVARLIFNSKIYQRKPSPDSDTPTPPVQRQLAAEQLLDSLFVVSGKYYDAGQMTFDIDGARQSANSLHLGHPRRSWMLTSTSNERDRPGLAMPFAAPFVSFLEQFGWRGARQNPISQRPDDLTALQPAEFANGVLARRTTRLSDDHIITQLAVQSNLQLSQLIDELYLRIFTRLPEENEREIVTAVLQPGYTDRLQLDEQLTVPERDRRGTISWSNHQEEEATTIKNELERKVRRGDPPTRRLTADWRERLEDVIWSLTNSPEFRFSP